MICCFTGLSNFRYLYRNEKKTKSGTLSIQIIVLSASTLILIILCNSLSKESPHHATKVKSMLSTYWNERESYPQFWDNLQTTYQCCGENDSSDWENCIPKSCYQSHTTWLIWRKIVTYNFPHENGCLSVIVNYLNEMTHWFKLIAISFISLGCIGIAVLLVIGFTSLALHNRNLF